MLVFGPGPTYVRVLPTRSGVDVRCPGCGSDDDRVVDSRPAPSGDAIRRRRECRYCGLRFTTFERVELPVLAVRKRSGAVVPFERERVLDGMARAAKGRVVAAALEDAAAAVERELRALGRREVSSEQVGLQVLAQLRDLDDVAYVRFASVYKDFQGPEDFELELSSLRKDAPPKSA
jgi:transcriptional repressor NrdR